MAIPRAGTTRGRPVDTGGHQTQCLLDAEVQVSGRSQVCQVHLSGQRFPLLWVFSEAVEERARTMRPHC